MTNASKRPALSSMLDGILNDVTPEASPAPPAPAVVPVAAEERRPAAATPRRTSAPRPTREAKPTTRKPDTEEASPAPPARFQIDIPGDLDDRLRDAIHATGRGMREIGEEALRRELERMERANGGPFPSRPTKGRKPGRPVR